MPHITTVTNSNEINIQDLIIFKILVLNKSIKIKQKIFLILLNTYYFYFLYNI
jgi:hypothetical protein